MDAFGREGVHAAVWPPQSFPSRIGARLAQESVCNPNLPTLLESTVMFSSY
jgi:hypothetical protein